jgi:hypothetical protein
VCALVSVSVALLGESVFAHTALEVAARVAAAADVDVVDGVVVVVHPAALLLSPVSHSSSGGEAAWDLTLHRQRGDWLDH